MIDAVIVAICLLGELKHHAFPPKLSEIEQRHPMICKVKRTPQFHCHDLSKFTCCIVLSLVLGWIAI